MTLAERALEFVKDGDVVGLGTGRAATAFVRALGIQVQAGLQIRAIPTSQVTTDLARELCIPLTTFEFVETIDAAAERCIDDSKVRAGIKRQARRYVAHDVVGIIASYRKSGASLKDVLPVIWRCRSELGHIGLEPGDIVNLARPAAIILLPRIVTIWLGQIRHGLGALRTRAMPDSYRSTNA